MTNYSSFAFIKNTKYYMIIKGKNTDKLPLKLSFTGL